MATGRPKISLDQITLQHLLDAGLTKATIARKYSISRPTLNAVIKDLNLQRYNRTAITDSDLDDVISEALADLPNMGRRMLIGYCRHRGINISQRRLSAAIKRVDPEGVAERTNLVRRRIRRRVYSVPYPHYMWHLDGNHKLIRWKMVVHACIDGFSRACLYLECSNNNSSATVLHHFNRAVQQCGTLPTSIRTDHGGENAGVWQQMLQHTDDNISSRPPVLIGSSVHNQRVERFNREINIHIRQKYGQIFYGFESQGLLDVTNAKDMFALHYIFLPRINRSLKLLMDSHNNHPISTEGNKSPNQLLLHTALPETTADVPIQGNTRQMIERLIEMDVPPVGPVQPSAIPISNEAFDHMKNALDPLTDDGNSGVELYKLAHEYVHS